MTGPSSMKLLHLADNLPLPPAVVTEKLAFLGRTGSGKTYGATKLAELLLSVGAQIVALDPVGVWPGLRMPGTGKGFSSLYVFGGLYGDFPLAPTGGTLMADVVVDRGISAVLDVSQFLHGEQTRFAYDFATRFFQRKKAAPAAVHLFVEECQEFIPQNVSGSQRGEFSEARMLHAFERLWKLGRNFGIGGSLISQRPQEVNKKALNQAGTLFVFQMTGPQERKAIKEWVAAQGLDARIDELLPTLRVGEPHVWSPTFLGVSKTVRILAKQTADISSTPTFGARSAERPLTPVDVKQLEADMAATIERAKADDPKELRREIAELKRQMAARPAASVERVEVPVVTKEMLEQIDGWVAGALDGLRAAAGGWQGLEAELSALRAAVGRAAALGSGWHPSAVPPQRGTSAAPAPRQRQAAAAQSRRVDATGAALAGGERKILTALAQYPDGRTKVQVAILTGYAHGGGGFNNYLSALRSRGLIAGSDRLVITDAGSAALGAYEPLPTGAALLDYWLGRLGKAERAALTELAAAYPKALAKDALAARAGYEANGGGFNNALSKLRTLELIEGRGEMLASEALFG